MFARQYWAIRHEARSSSIQDHGQLCTRLTGISNASRSITRKRLISTTQVKPTKGTGVHRFLKIKRDLGWDFDPKRSKYSSYSCRHTFAHRMLAGFWNEGVGCSIETLAELMGDTPKVAFDHYGREWGQNYQEPLWTAIGVSQ